MRALLAIFAVVAVCAAAWLLLTGGGGTLDEFGTDAPTGPEEYRPEPGAPARAPAAPEEAAAGIEGGAEIRGTVTRNGEPVSAEVLVTRVADLEPVPGTYRDLLGRWTRWLAPSVPDRPPHARARSGEDGEYRVSGLSPGGYRVEAVGPGGASRWTRRNLPDDLTVETVDLDLVTGPESVTGRAVRQDGSAFVGWIGVTIVHPTGGSSSFGREVETGPGGAFAFSGMPSKEILLVAIDPGRARHTSAKIALPHEGEIVFVVDEGLVPLTGRAVRADDGTPVPGATILSGGGGQERSTWAATVADEEGNFRLLLPEDPNWMMGGADGFASGWVYQDAIRDGMEFPLRRLGRVTGRVTTEGGEPVVGIPVYALPMASDDRGMAATSRTGADGVYEIADAVPGDLTVFAHGGGFTVDGIADLSRGGYNRFVVSLPPGGEATADLTVIPAAEVHGRVVTDDDRPAPGVPIVVTLRGHGEFPMDALVPERVASGADGRVVLAGLAPDLEYRFVATPSGGGASNPVAVTPRIGEAAEVELRLPPVRFLTVLVRDRASGAPVVEAEVDLRVRTPDGGENGIPGRHRTNEAGEVRIGPLPAGDLSVTIQHAEYVDVQEGIPVPGPATGESELRLEAAMDLGRKIRGLVVGPDGVAVASARVSAQSRGPWTSGWYWGNTTSGADGRFELAGLREGTYEISAQAFLDRTGLSGETVAEAGGDEVTIRLAAGDGSEEGAALEVHVVGPDGRPATGGSYRFSQTGDGGSSSTGGTLTGGGFHQQVEPGSYQFMWILLWGAKAADGTMLEALAHGPVGIAGGELTLSLGPGREVSGRVVDSTGEGVRGVRVRAQPLVEGFPWMDGMEQAPAWTAADGTFRLTGLGDLSYTLVVSAPKEFAPVAPLAIRPGARDVVIRLLPGTEVEVRILDWQGKPAAGVVVQATPVGDTAGETLSARTGGDGTARVAGLDGAGTYRLDLEPPDDRDDLLARSVTDWRPASGEFRLERAYVVRGFVRDPGGRPISGATVWIQTGDHGWSGSEVGADGAFSFEDLPAGEVTLRVTIGDGFGPFRTAEKNEMTVAAGSEGVIFTVDPGLKMTLRFKDLPAGSDFLFVEVTPENGAEGEMIRDWHHGGATKEIRGLDASLTYTVVVHVQMAGDQAMIGYVRGAVPGAAEIDVPIVDALSISGRVVLPEGAGRCFVSAEAPGISHGVQADEAGNFTIGGLPSTVVTVEVSVVMGNEVWTTSAEVAAGREIVLTPKPPEKDRR